MNHLKFVIAFLFIGLVSNVYAQYQTSENFSEKEFTANYKATTLELTQGGKVISHFQEGAAIVERNGKYGLVNKQGFEICQTAFEAVTLFSNGYAAVKKNNKWTFVNKQGQKLTPHRYEWVGTFNEGLAAVQYDGKWGLLNEQGYEVVATEFDELKKDMQGNILALKDGKWTIVVAKPAPVSSPTAQEDTDNDILLSVKL